MRKSWNELIAPFTELRAHYRDYLKALSNARRYGTTSETSAIYFRIAGFTFSRLWRILKTLLNYAAPIAACVVCVLTIQYFTRPHGWLCVWNITGSISVISAANPFLPRPKMI